MGPNDCSAVRLLGYLHVVLVAAITAVLVAFGEGWVVSYVPERRAVASVSFQTLGAIYLHARAVGGSIRIVSNSWRHLSYVPGRRTVASVSFQTLAPSTRAYQRLQHSHTYVLGVW